MTTSMKNQVEDDLALIPQLYPAGVYSQMVPQQGLS